MTGHAHVFPNSTRRGTIPDRAVAAVRELRAEYIPAAFAGSGATVLVTGTTAENIDYFDVMSRWLPIVLVFILKLAGDRGLMGDQANSRLSQVIGVGTALGASALSVALVAVTLLGAG